MGFGKRRTRKGAMKRLAVTGRFIAKRSKVSDARAKGSKEPLRRCMIFEGREVQG
jgi:hypothetical protein